MIEVKAELVEILVDEYQEAGYKNGIWNISDLSNGVYYYRLTVDDFTAVRKAVLMK